MVFIEQIKVRTGTGNSQKDLEVLQQIAAEATASIKGGRVILYKHGSILGDFCYFLFWDRSADKFESSSLGLEIRRSLEELGIVDYTVWQLIK